MLRWSGEMPDFGDRRRDALGSVEHSLLHQVSPYGRRVPRAAGFKTTAKFEVGSSPEDADRGPGIAFTTDGSLFDWDALDRAEAHVRTRSLPARIRRVPKPDRRLPAPMQFVLASESESEREVEAEDSMDAASPKDADDSADGFGPLKSTEWFALSSPLSSEASASDDEIGDVGEGHLGQSREGPSETAIGFKTWVNKRQPMLRLSVGGCVSQPSGGASSPSKRKPTPGRAWDFPLAKTEKRELLLLHLAAGEKLAAEQAAEAQREAKLWRRQQQEQEHELKNQQLALSRRFSGGSRRLSGGSKTILVKARRRRRSDEPSIKASETVEDKRSYYPRHLVGSSS
mmetsp:Transcript_95725/g.172684  ORF Transcript_95725/g.172684 Transcript_95725/m.172684 type:complete len:343 (+) Transcript_95725:117-1145(+)